MVGYRLSLTGTAKHPFYIGSVSVRLWSVEELCWFLHRYPALIDEHVVSLALTRWLAEEFHITETAVKMERGLKNGGGADDFLIPLFEDADYLPPRELQAYAAKLREIRAAGLAGRMKMKADAMVRNRRYGRGVSLYYQAAAAAHEQDRKLKAKIWHNCGTALMQLLEYEEACRAFRKALDENETPEETRAYLTAVYLSQPEEVFQREAEHAGAGADLVREIIAAAEKAYESAEDVPEDRAGTEKILKKLRDAYHLEAEE